MEVKDLLARLYEITGLSDFLVIKAGHNPKRWGQYYMKNKVIVLYHLDEEGAEYPEETLIRVACHELAHHLQYHYIKGYQVPEGDEHDLIFKKTFAELLEKYYNGEVPQSTLDFVEGEGLNYADSKKKSRAPKRRAKSLY